MFLVKSKSYAVFMYIIKIYLQKIKMYRHDLAPKSQENQEIYFSRKSQIESQSINQPNQFYKPKERYSNYLQFEQRNNGETNLYRLQSNPRRGSFNGPLYPNNNKLSNNIQIPIPTADSNEIQLLDAESYLRQINRLKNQKILITEKCQELITKLQAAQKLYQKKLSEKELNFNTWKQQIKKDTDENNKYNEEKLVKMKQYYQGQVDRIKKENLATMDSLKHDYEKLLEKAQQEYQQLRHQGLFQLDKQREHYTNLLQQTNSKNANNLSHLKKEHDKQILNTKINHQKELKDKITQFNKQIEQLKQFAEVLKRQKEQINLDLSTEMSSQKNDYLRELHNEKTDKEAQIHRLTLHYENEINDLKSQLNILKDRQLKKKSDQVADLLKQIDILKQDLANLKQQKLSIIAEQQEKKNNLEIEHKKTISKLNLQHQTTIDELKRNQHKTVMNDFVKNQDLEAVRNQYQAEIDKITAGLTQQMNFLNQKLFDCKNQHLQNINRMKSKHNEQIAKLQQKYQNDICNLKIQYEKQCNRWASDYQNAVKQFNRQCRKIDGQSNKMAQSYQEKSKRTINKIEEQKNKQVNQLRRQFDAMTAKITKMQEELDKKNMHNQELKLQLQTKKKDTEKQIKNLQESVQKLQEKLKINQQKLQEAQQLVNSLNIKITNIQKSHTIELQAKEQLIANLQYKNKQKIIEHSSIAQTEQLEKLKKIHQNQKHELEKKHQLQIKCLNNKIQMLTQTISKKQGQIRLAQDQNNKNIEDLIKNKSTKDISGVKIKETEEQRKTSNLIQQLMSYSKDLEIQNHSLSDEVQSLKNTNKKLRQQLKNNLLGFSKQRQWLEQINMLKAKVKGYQQLRKGQRNSFDSQSANKLKKFSPKKYSPRKEYGNHVNSKVYTSPISRSYKITSAVNDYTSPKKIRTQFIQTNTDNKPVYRVQKKNLSSKYSGQALDIWKRKNNR